MAINPESQYPGKIAPSSPSYPYGAARNITAPGDGTGTPWEAALVNDLFGFQQALLSKAAVVPSGSPETALVSQYLQALQKLPGLTSTTTFATVADLKTGDSITGVSVTFADLAAVQSQAATIVNNTTTNGGGNLYVVKTRAQHRVDINNPTWEPDGGRDFYLDGGITYVAVSKNPTVTPLQVGWLGDKAGPRLIADLIEAGVDFAIPKPVKSMKDQWASWFAGSKAPICFYGDSTTDGRVTTIDGVILASQWNIDRLVGNEVPDGLVYDHDDSEVPNAYPNILQRILRGYHRNNNIRVYNAGYRGKQVQDGWAVDNVYNAVYGNTTYADLEWVGIMFGLNDSNVAGGEVLRANTYRETKALILDAYARGVQPALMSAPPSDNTADDNTDYGHNEEADNLIDQVKRRIVEEFAIEFVDINAAIKKWVYQNHDAIKFTSASPDGLHLNDIGHLKKAEWIFTWAASGNVPILGNEKRRFGVIDSVMRFTKSRTGISSADPDRGRNKLAENAVLDETDLANLADSDAFDLWVWNDYGDLSLDYMAYKSASNDWSLSAPANFPQVIAESQLFTALEFHKITIFDNAVPEAIASSGGGRPDLNQRIGALRWGLNRIRLRIPPTIGTAIADGVFGGQYYPASALEIVPQDARNIYPVMQQNYGFNFETIAPWRNVFRDTGPMLMTKDIVTPALPSNFQAVFTPRAKDNINVFSMSQDGDIVEWGFKIGSFSAGIGAVLSYQLVDNASLTPPGGVSKDDIFQSGSYVIFYANNAGTVRLAYISPTNAPITFDLTGVTLGDVSGNNMRLKATRNGDFIDVDLMNAAGVSLFTGQITDPVFVSTLQAGTAGGAWTIGGVPSTNAFIDYMRIREYR